MRILILGGDGMLGHQLLIQLRKDHEVKITLRRPLTDYAQFDLFTADNTIDQLDLRDEDALRKVVLEFSPELIINAAGVIKQRDSASDTLLNLEINSVLPHRLADLCLLVGARMIHFSTDCIFRGDRGSYSEHDISDAIDIYGRTKFLGEVAAPHCVTLRTSIIGLELHRKTSLIEWFLRQTGDVKGFTNAIFTGVTTMELGRLISDTICSSPDMAGLYHVASEPISKFDLLSQLSVTLGREDVRVIPDESFRCDRSLLNGRLLENHAYAPPPWNFMIDELAESIRQRTKIEMKSARGERTK
jgi:dTDP-4-dehydrorhamnose reductase